MDIISRTIRYVDYLDSFADKRSTSTLLLSTSWIPISAIALYLLFVLWIGPRFMANRKRYSLTKTIMAYNLIQIAANIYLIFQLSWPYFQFNIWCRYHPYYNTEESLAHMHFCSYFYYILKLVDLLDTIFFILRKKKNQVTFLHVFHHAAIVALTWIGTMWLPGGAKMFAVWLNSLVHVLMYSYYFVASLHIPGSTIFKPYVTTVQLLQFVIITVHLSLLVLLGLCKESKTFSIGVVAFNMSMFILFWRFYKRSYRPQGHAGFVHKIR